ncbi:ATP-binding cassette transporter [Mycena indigotica]|uniref:ATP-binding cassette transporter n=1 Tax=Mycena indigotica TaxID=2126181 RepID=A0A8H6WGE0_9AGAR|nr:ATP-binding cassette transporter [Mycena indigotica]KAF7315751.1 ATP-binding cassette transporter [Mycena indigotica]
MSSDSLWIPFYATATSIGAFVVHSLWLRAKHWKGPVEDDDNRQSTAKSLSEHVQQHGGMTIFGFNAARLVTTLVLLCLSIFSLALDSEQEGNKSGGAFAGMAVSGAHWVMTWTFFYASIMTILTLVTSPESSRLAVKHLNLVLFPTFCVFFYRDIYPLLTLKLQPLDAAEGLLLWIKLTLLFVVAVVIPITVPREYIPVDPKNPFPPSQVTPEQTASILSIAVYSFLDPIIFLGYRVPHLSYDQLPPLADYDHAKNLKKHAFPYMDVFTNKRGHIFWQILLTFSGSFVLMAVALLIHGFAGFISPIAMNRLLNYLEGSSEGFLMKPGFWILLLLLGPVINSLAFQWFIFESTHVANQSTSIITQLVFEHALRIRVKADVNDKNKDSASDSDKKPSKKTDQDSSLLGKLTNLVSSDLQMINEGRNVMFLVVLVPIQIIGSVFFLYQVLGWSAFVGMAVMVALLPVPGYITKLEQTAQKATLEKKDARVQTVTEILNVLRMVKMFGWEKQMEGRIEEKREDELKQLWKRRMLDLFSNLANSSMAVFDLLRNQLFFSFYTLSVAVNAKVSLDRLNDFLHKTELLDSLGKSTLDEDRRITAGVPASNSIGFRDATFSWSADEAEVDGTVTPSSRRFLLKIEGELLFKPGVVNLIIGPTGSGKTSLLMALLGEMHLVHSSLTSWHNLPRGKGVSYASQESWVINDTIKNNILFNAPYNEARYKKVLNQCCLERDLELWQAGDETEVGEKGLTLSGGQKARVTLARAIYSDSAIILLDDILAALDVHTAKYIVSKCLKGDLIQGRTVILVTHNVALTSPIAGFVVSLGLDGRILSRGSVSDALANDEALAKEVREEEEQLAAADKEIDSQVVATEDLAKKDKGKLIVAEELAIGHVSWSALSLYLRGMSGSHQFFFWSVLAVLIIAGEVGVTLQTWYLGFWASQYGEGVVVPVFKYLGGFGIILAVSFILFAITYVFYVLGSFRASRSLHKQLIDSILGTTLRWLDTTPVSRIIARCTVDIGAVDNFLAEALRAVLTISVAMLTKFAAVVFFAPVFFIGGLLVGVIGMVTGRIYMASQLSVKREQSNARAPVLAHFGATMSGLVSVRAYGAQDALIGISQERIDRLTRATRTFMNLNRWVTVRIDVLGGLFASSLAYYVVYLTHERAFNVGFSLNMALGFAELILYLVRLLNMFEVQGNSVERIQQYLNIEQEPRPTASGVPPAYWPASGNLTVENLKAKYSPDGEEVLHSLSFEIKSGERVGVVGRTGSGKSSLTLALLRCILTEGNVIYDGIPTSKLNLDALRSAITIIPQVPELLVGSLRSNLDIFNQFDDATLNSALRAAGLASLQAEMEADNEGRLTLDTEIAAGGANLSVGQRQIIALARAIVRGSKLLILDEATSAIDYKTDAVIQTSLRTELPPDTTLLTVAHRLQTIMDADKIMVLDAGQIAEFDSPRVLLEKEGGLLKALVDESGDRDALYDMAKK